MRRHHCPQYNQAGPLWWGFNSRKQPIPWTTGHTVWHVACARLATSHSRWLCNLHPPWYIWPHHRYIPSVRRKNMGILLCEEGPYTRNTQKIIQNFRLAGTRFRVRQRRCDWTGNNRYWGKRHLVSVIQIIVTNNLIPILGCNHLGPGILYTLPQKGWRLACTSSCMMHCIWQRGAEPLTNPKMPTEICEANGLPMTAIRLSVNFFAWCWLCHTWLNLKVSINYIYYVLSFTDSYFLSSLLSSPCSHSYVNGIKGEAQYGFYPKIESSRLLEEGDHQWEESCNGHCWCHPTSFQFISQESWWRACGEARWRLG